MKNISLFFIIALLLLPFSLGAASFGSVSGLTACGRTQTSICWNWTNPTGFNHTIHYLNGANVINLSNTTGGYVFTGLTAKTAYLLTVHTANGTAINSTDVNDTQLTKSNPILDADSTEFLPDTGSHLGTMLKNVIPGIAAILLVFALLAGIGPLLYQIFKKVKGEE